MSIAGITSSPLVLTTSIRAASDAVESAATTRESLLQTQAAALIRSNPLQGNFVTQHAEQSRYVTGLMETYRVGNAYSAKLMGIVEQYKLEAAAADNYAEASLAGAKAARAVQELGDRETTEKVGEQLEQDRQEMEQEIEEQVAEKQQAQSDQGSEQAAASEEGSSSAVADAAAVTTVADAAAAQESQAPAFVETAQESVEQETSPTASSTDSLPRTSLDLTV